jgi:uncharacterized membrane protein YphA (DoxX/SURF4 family)
MARKILLGFLTLMFLVTCVSKLAGISPSPENFTRWGLSLTMMRLIGALEVTGAIGLQIPRLSRAAAIGLIALMFGAIRTGILFHEPLHIFLPLALIILLAIAAGWRRSKL